MVDKQRSRNTHDPSDNDSHSTISSETEGKLNWLDQRKKEIWSRQADIVMDTTDEEATRETGPQYFGGR